MTKKAPIATISWEGDSWDVLKSWPKAIQWDFGDSLREMQHGRAARLKVRPMQSIDKGVFELKDADERPGAGSCIWHGSKTPSTFWTVLKRTLPRRNGRPSTEQAHDWQRYVNGFSRSARMKSGNVASRAGHITTGDIFDDLGFSPAETLEAKIKSDLLHAIVQHSKVHDLSQAGLAQALNIHQPDVSNLLKGKISKFSITRLIQFAARLNLEPRVEVSSPMSAKTISLKAQAQKTSRARTTLLKA